LPALSGRIFFPVYDPNPDRFTMDIYAVRLPSGERQIVLGQASQPALSWDGKRLAFRSWDGTRRGIVVRELTDGNTWTWVAYGEAARPSWGPDNQAIVFASQQESDRRWRLYRTRGPEIDQIRRHGGDILGRVPAWLVDGRIVYWECPEDKCGLYVMQGDGSSPVRLTMAEHDTAPAASPDGSRIAFMSNRDGDWDIFMVELNRPEGPEGEGITQLTSNAARDGLPVWSPDGRWLAFVSDRNGAWALWVMRPDGSAQRKLFNLGGPLEGRIAGVVDEDQHGWTWESLAWGH
jgi:Tol biopolymer transport system component